MESNMSSKAARQLRKAWRAGSGQPDRRVKPEAATASPRRPGRATFHLPADLLDDMRNTVVALSGPPHRLTMSKLADTAIRRELDRLRKERGGRDQGKVFGQRSAQVTRGRPIR
jgi:hypothetical protein